MRGQSLLLGGAILALVSIYNSAGARAQNANGKDCRMEQQSHWENFKKICVWVKFAVSYSGYHQTRRKL